jgi:hypothetical protein
MKKAKDTGSRERIITLLDGIWAKSPEMRFGQLLVSLGVVVDSPALYNAEDSEIEGKLLPFKGWKKMGKARAKELKGIKELYEHALEHLEGERLDVQAKMRELDSLIKDVEAGVD